VWSSGVLFVYKRQEQGGGELADSVGLATTGEQITASALIPRFALPQ
jgi:hypothetical protein